MASKPISRLSFNTVATPIPYDLLDKTGESTYLEILNDDKVLYLQYFDGVKSVRIAGKVGGEYGLYCSVPGYVLLAYADDDFIEEYTSRSLEKRIENSITEKSALLGKLVSCVYRFKLDDENINITNTLEAKNILATFVTENPNDQYGVDGIEFDHDDNLLIGNFGDGAVYKITFNDDLSVKSNEIWAQDKENLESTDGMIMDENGNLYIADFCANAIVKILPDGTVTKLAQNGDTDGFNGELDQPGEPIIWNGKLMVSCFDTVANDIVVNTKHELPATLAEIELQKRGSCNVKLSKVKRIDI